MFERKWGLGITIFIRFVYLTGIYNMQSGFSLFHVPDEYADPQNTQINNVMTLLPLLLNIYLVSEFVKARQKAEMQISDQKIKLEEKNKNITDSINYASRINTALREIYCKSIKTTE